MLIKPREAIARLAIKYNGDWNKIYDAVRSKDFASDECYAPTCDYVTILDPEYPAKFRDSCAKPPFVLFYKGDLSLIQDDKKCVSFVGGRTASEMSARQIAKIAKALSDDGYAIIAGSADGTAKVALENASRPVCVLACGFDNPYPKKNARLLDDIAERGLLISEYPPHVEAEAKNFPMKSRIVVGLSSVTAVGEANKHSGTAVAVAFALEFGKDVGVILPYADCGNESFNDELIENGAMPIFSAKSVRQMTA